MTQVVIGLIYMIIAVLDAWADPDSWTIMWAVSGVFWILFGLFIINKRNKILINALKDHEQE